MMLLWVALILMSLLAAGLLLLPLLRRHRTAPSSAEHELAVYRDQLAEVQRDLERGVLGPEQAASARLEIERRMLRVLTATPSPSGTARRSVAVAALVAMLVPTGAVLVYLMLGQPQLSDMPHGVGNATEQQVHPDVAEFTRLTEQLAERLEKNPDDPRGWSMLGRSYRLLERIPQSIAAFRRAVALAGGIESAPPQVLADLGEVLVIEDGKIGPEAHDLFTRAALDPAQMKARHYLASERAQAGDLRGALAAWRAIEAEAPADAPWLAPLREQINRVAVQLGIDPAIVAPERMRGVAEAIAPGTPSPETMEAAAQMPPEDRERFIRSMVDRLAGRLAERPDDAEGWVRLGRAYGVLGDAERARTAFGRAAALLRRDLDALAPDAPQRREIEEKLRLLDKRS